MIAISDVSAAPFSRMAASMWRQRSNLIPEPEGRLDGQRIAVTGGNGGVGLATARGLLARGAEVVLLCRSQARAEAALDSLVGLGSVSWIACDLADLDSVATCADALMAAGRPLEALVLNAGIWPQRYAETAQGFEIAFGVNVLAHALLTRSLLAGGGLTQHARVVWVTGDIYVMTDACTPDFRYRGPWGGQLAYCRSKLGDLWMRAVFEARFPGRRWYAVHPGVVATNLGGDVPGAAWIKGALMISPEEGARTSLTCVASPDLDPGYYHNTLGQVRLPGDDPGRDMASAEALYRRCEALLAPWI